MKRIHLYNVYVRHLTGKAREPLNKSINSLQFWKSLCIGIAAGAGGSLVGMGGAFIAMPFLTGSLKLNQHNAHGTSMSVALFTSAGSCIAYISGNSVSKQINDINHNGNNTSSHIDFPSALGIATFGSVSAVIGAKLSKSFPTNTLKIAHAILMLAMAPAIHLKDLINKKN